MEEVLSLATLPTGSEVTPPGAPSLWRCDPARRAFTWAMRWLEPGAALKLRAFNRPLVFTVRASKGDPTLGQQFLLDEGSGC
ncbi:MAG: hypothetical protein RML36_11795 [Anaerolineae bacterium]|nr:hypothetical protein [Anaerolineae bacterium]MDW8100151.1 hypothetical protein [Anaerolineae bacterium]